MTLSDAGAAALDLRYRFHAAAVAQWASYGTDDIGLRTRLDDERTAAQAAWDAARSALPAEEQASVWAAWDDSGHAYGECDCARTVRELLRAQGVVA